ncbi:TIGR01777 family oxidoreductase [Boudabousia marimammalium]|uniref:TIGR01777 family protein n=1 Tax=Boudabousia marimammalium TaxID=156892 RepID=A0A1Q5PM72_9ACTO|nr:TIGR01777 family oxidoreductase [Boudabousia marimammalium]OKL48641.1 TIGR01777 family protein [Boudabousia marimammalium]
MAVLTIAGAGLLGSRLADLAEQSGWTVRVLHRVKSPRTQVKMDKFGREHAHWNPAQGLIPATALAGSTAVVCLNGAAIAPQPWTPKRRALLESSRIDSVNTLVQGMAALPAEARPQVFLSGSAIGFYGSRGDRVLVEHDHAGKGFLADLCVRWEVAAQAAASLGVRVALSRTSLIVAAEDGIGARLHHLYRWGLGARLGDGKQWQSYVSLNDAARALLWVIEHEDVSGPFNLAAPAPIQNGELHDYLNGVYRWKSRLAAPSFAVRALGKMGRELLLASQRVIPKKLTDSGFIFEDVTVPDIWRSVYGMN